jgi:predicted alpha/beta hydrolase family esterase
MPGRSFLILHGWQGNSPGHWQTWLADRLRAAGHTVAYPELPDPCEPYLPAWLVALEAELARLPGEPVVACHSLGCLLWMHRAARRGAPGRALLVAPPSPYLGIHELAPFFPAPATPPLAPGTRLVCADDDPYCPEGTEAAYPRLGVPVDVIPRGAHLNVDAGYGPWPAVEAWCLGQGDSAVTSSRIAPG